MNVTTRVVLGLLITCAAVGAQTSTAQINGTIHDASGLAVPTADIRVTQTATGAIHGRHPKRCQRAGRQLRVNQSAHRALRHRGE
jgi:hypothetical protein